MQCQLHGTSEQASEWSDSDCEQASSAADTALSCTSGMFDKGHTGCFSFDDADGNCRMLLVKKLLREQPLNKDSFFVKFEVTKEIENLLLPAIKGVTLRQAIEPLLLRRSLSLDSINVYLDFSSTPLSLHFDTFHLGGASLRIRDKDDGPKKAGNTHVTAAAFDKGPRVADVWNSNEGPYRKISSGNLLKPAIIGRTSSSASLPSSSRRGTWHEKSYENVMGISQVLRLSEGYGDDTEMAGHGGTARRKGGGGGGSGSIDDSSVQDVSPSGTMSKGSRASHRLTASFFSLASKEKDKAEKLASSLDEWSRTGLPSMPSGASATSMSKHEAALVEIEDHWTSFISKSGLSQRQTDQQEALWELLHTEVEYTRSLNVVHDLFMCCLLNLQNMQLLNDIAADQLFSNMTDIIRVNSEFWEAHMLPVLQASRSSQCLLDPRLLKPAFSKFSEQFHPYKKYCLEHGPCSEYMKKVDRENELFKAYVAWAEAHKLCNRLKLHDLLVKPMQRLTRYSLLLRAIAKKTDDADSKADLAEMVDNVDRFVKQVDQALRQKHEADRLQNLAARIESYDAVDMPYSDTDLAKLLSCHTHFDLKTPIPGCGTQIRQLLHEGPLKMKDSNTKQDVYCFLFSDLLLITKATRRAEKVKIIKAPLTLDRLVVEQHCKDGNPYLLLLHLCEYGVAQAAYAFHGENIPTWMSMIQNAQATLLKIKANRTDELSLQEPRLAAEVGEEEEETGYAGPELRRISSSVSNFDILVPGFGTSTDSLTSCDTDFDESAVLPSPRHLLQQCSNSEAKLTTEHTYINDGCGDDSGSGSASPTRGQPKAHILPGHFKPIHDSCGRSSSKGSCDSSLTRTLSPSRERATHYSPLPLCSREAIELDSQRLSQEGSRVAGECACQTECPLPSAPASLVTKVNKGGSRRRPGFERRYHTADAIRELRGEGVKDTAIHKRLSWNLGTVSSATSMDDKSFSRRSSQAASMDSVRSSTSGVSSINSTTRTSPEEANEICEEEAEGAVEDAYEDAYEEAYEEAEDLSEEETSGAAFEQPERLQTAAAPAADDAEAGLQEAAVQSVTHTRVPATHYEAEHVDETAVLSAACSQCNYIEAEAHLRIEADEEGAVCECRNTNTSATAFSSTALRGRVTVRDVKEGIADAVLCSVPRLALPAKHPSAVLAERKRLSQADLLRMRNHLLISTLDAAEV